MSINKQLNKENGVHIYNGILFIWKENIIMTSAGKQMELDIIMSRKIGLNQKDENYVFSLMCTLDFTIYTRVCTRTCTHACACVWGCIVMLEIGQ